MLCTCAGLRKKLLKYHDMKNKLDIISTVIFVVCIMTLAAGVHTNNLLICCIGGFLAGIYNYINRYENNKHEPRR